MHNARPDGRVHDGRVHARRDVISARAEDGGLPRGALAKPRVSGFFDTFPLLSIECKTHLLRFACLMPPLYISQKRKAALLRLRPAFYGPTDQDALKWDKSMEKPLKFRKTQICVTN